MKHEYTLYSLEKDAQQHMTACNHDSIRLSKLREIKKQMYKVDGPRCVYCSATTVLVRKAKTDSWATIDHIIPRSNGGTDDIDNLVIACYDCNNSKGSEPKEIPQAIMQYLKQKSRIERISYACGV